MSPFTPTHQCAWLKVISNCDVASFLLCSISPHLNIPSQCFPLLRCSSYLLWFLGSTTPFPCFTCREIVDDDVGDIFPSPLFFFFCSIMFISGEINACYSMNVVHSCISIPPPLLLLLLLMSLPKFRDILRVMWGKIKRRRTDKIRWCFASLRKRLKDIGVSRDEKVT